MSVLSIEDWYSRKKAQNTQNKKLYIICDVKFDGLIKSPSTGRGRVSPGLGLGWNHLNSFQMAGEGKPSSAE
jgi:hypothetical protein